MFKIDEENYKKDPIEVPVFEYSCQIGNSENILVGDYILAQHENCVYFYTFIKGNNLSPNSVYDSQPVEIVGGGYGLRVSSAVEITAFDWRDYLTLRLHINETYAFCSKEMYRELMFIAKEVPDEIITSNQLKIYTNFYKLN